MQINANDGGDEAWWIIMVAEKHSYNWCSMVCPAVGTHQAGDFWQGHIDCNHDQQPVANKGRCVDHRHWICKAFITRLVHGCWWENQPWKAGGFSHHPADPTNPVNWKVLMTRWCVLDHGSTGCSWSRTRQPLVMDIILYINDPRHRLIPSSRTTNQGIKSPGKLTLKSGSQVSPASYVFMIWNQL